MKSQDILDQVIIYAAAIGVILTFLMFNEFYFEPQSCKGYGLRMGIKTKHELFAGCFVVLQDNVIIPRSVYEDAMKQAFFYKNNPVTPGPSNRSQVLSP